MPGIAACLYPFLGALDPCISPFQGESSWSIPMVEYARDLECLRLTTTTLPAGLPPSSSSSITHRQERRRDRAKTKNAVRKNKEGRKEKGPQDRSRKDYINPLDHLFNQIYYNSTSLQSNQAFQSTFYFFYYRFKSFYASTLPIYQNAVLRSLRCRPGLRPRRCCPRCSWHPPGEDPVPRRPGLLLHQQVRHQG